MTIAERLAGFATRASYDDLSEEARDQLRIRVLDALACASGPEVNLFVDHSQIVQLECLREGIWGTADLWGKVVTYKGSGESR
jgi:2-methylcitrate dehydratase PrpD